MHFHCLQHVFFETPGYIESWIRYRKHTLSFTKFFDHGILPPHEDFDAVIIMGGHMSVHDEKDYPWLRAEKQFLAEVISQGKKMIGICLGSQLIAEVLGAKVYPNPEKEIGFISAHLTEKAKKDPLFSHFPDEWMVFHWHGETFTLPDRAIHLAYTNSCANQAFKVGGKILGFQFHPEATPQIVREMVIHGLHELVPLPFIDAPEKILNGLDLLKPNKVLLYSLLDQFFKNPLI